MSTNTERFGTLIELSNVLLVRFDLEPGFAYVRVPGKLERLTMSEFRTLIDRGSVSI